jgi:preprotein translocase subunit SecA|tara:strand:+ start:7835 stop:8038 length:204 start_codon:yes stop_codon:yes gene_type:complete
MKQSSILKKFESEVEEVYNALDKLTEVLHSTEDYELSELGNELSQQISDSLEEGEINLELIRDKITS